ncbi:MAG: hypothetical protein ABI706_07720 [Ilumatobacteraceae bacterium]
MTRLHIEHPITDYETWRSAFDRFVEARAAAGVVGTRVSRPVDDDRFIVIDLEFASADAAAGFAAFLEQNIWSTPANSPGLGGHPRTMILDDVD